MSHLKVTHYHECCSLAGVVSEALLVISEREGCESVMDITVDVKILVKIPIGIEGPTKQPGLAVRPEGRCRHVRIASCSIER